MSRTVRRKTVQYHLPHRLTECRRIPGSYRYAHYPVDPRSKEGRQIVAKYHSDAGFGDHAHCGVPHWYRKHIGNQRKTEELRELHRSLADPEYDAVPPVFIHDAGWYW